MATNDFLVFGGGAGANVITQVTYSGLAARTAGFSSGVAQSAQLNKVWRQSSIMAAVLAQFISDITGQDVLDDGTTTTLLANLKMALRMPAYTARGLVGANNAATPNTKYDVAADILVLRNPNTGMLATRTTTGTITCDVTVAGPAANGRDQAGAFSASTWLHLYFIWNGATLATVASTVAPPTGPTLPGAYTHWAYIGAIYFNASSQLVKTRIRGNRANYYAQQNVVSAGSATTETPVSLVNVIPPNAITAFVNAGGQVNCSASGSAQTFVGLRVDSGVDFWSVPISATTSNVGLNGSNWEIPNVGQNLYYLWFSETNPGNITLRAAQVTVIGYTIPNGAC